MTGTAEVPGEGPPEAPRDGGPAVQPPDEMAQLRALLLGRESARLDALDARISGFELTPEELAERLPEAIAMRTRQDRQLGVALAPTVEKAISESVRRRPAEFADAIFPVLGPAIRKAIAETMSELVGSINRAMEHSFSVRGLRWRIEAWRSGVPYAQVVLRHALVYRVEQVFLVHTGTGLLLGKASPPDLDVPDADLVSAMLTAIRDFVGDSFAHDAKAGGLRTFSVGELTVIVEPGPLALLAAVVRGQPAESFRRKMQETIEGVHAQFGSALEDFQGDSADFEGVQPLLDDCLVTVLDTDSTPGTPVNWRPVAIGALLVIAVLGTVAVRSAMRWRRVVSALEATPGLTVIRAERGWWRRSIHGLRDPDSPAPGSIIAAQGGDTTRTDQRWAPYLSLEPAVALARASRLLARPEGAEFALRADTLVISGHAPLGWVAAVAARRVLPSGVGAIDDGAVTLDLPAEAQALARELAEGRVLFAIGSATPGAPGSTSLGAAAARIAQLRGRLRALGGDVALDVVGRTDGTGTDAANTALSEQRAEVVRAALAPAMAGSLIRTRALGATAPLDAPDAAARARVNRSVSLEVRLVLRPSSPAPRE